MLVEKTVDYQEIKIFAVQNIDALNAYEQAHNYSLLELTMALKMLIYITLEKKMTHKFVHWHFVCSYPQDSECPEEKNKKKNKG